MFHSIRRWRIDYAWPEYLIAVEIEGGVFTNGRHIRPKGFVDDMEKYNTMAIMGWLLLRFTPKKINYELIRQIINQKRFKKV